jgi:hypothetical protein
MRLLARQFVVVRAITISSKWSLWESQVKEGITNVAPLW